LHNLSIISPPRDASGLLSMEATARTYRYLDAAELEEIRKTAAAKAKPGAKK
jgi:type IV pilus assembly protein PilO